MHRFICMLAYNVACYILLAVRLALHQFLAEHTRLKQLHHNFYICRQSCTSYFKLKLYDLSCGYALSPFICYLYSEISSYLIIHREGDSCWYFIWSLGVTKSVPVVTEVNVELVQVHTVNFWIEVHINNKKSF